MLSTSGWGVWYGITDISFRLLLSSLIKMTWPAGPHSQRRQISGCWDNWKTRSKTPLQGNLLPPGSQGFHAGSRRRAGGEIFTLELGYSLLPKWMFFLEKVKTALNPPFPPPSFWNPSLRIFLEMYDQNNRFVMQKTPTSRLQIKKCWSRCNTEERRNWRLTSTGKCGIPTTGRFLTSAPIKAALGITW